MPPRLAIAELHPQEPFATVAGERLTSQRQPVAVGMAVANEFRRIRTEGAGVNDGGTREVLAKSRRLVLLSRNLVRLLAKRIDLAEQVKAGIGQSGAGQSGRQLTNEPTAGSV